MTGPADRMLVPEISLDDLTSHLQARPHKAHTPRIHSAWHRLSRRGALAVLFGAAAALVAERSAALAMEASTDGALAAAAPDEGGDPPPTDGAPAADSPPADAPASGATAAPASDPPAAAAAPATTAPVALKTYTVQAGDTMYAIAKKHAVSVDAVLWANNLTDANVLKAGQQLTIPPATGKLVIAKDSDTLDSLASTYSVSKAGIAAVNGLTEDATLKAGQRLLVPVSTKADPASTSTQLTAASSSDPVPINPNGASGSPTPPSSSTLSSMMQTPSVLSSTGTPTVTVNTKKVPKLAWPINMSLPKVGISRGFMPGHTGVDIYAPVGTPILAAAAGTIKMAANEPTGFSGYGNIVVLDIGDGVQTWYAHCSKFNSAPGDKVKAGDTIGFVGNTGRADGYHLHFELRIGAAAVDPRLALPQP